jgi:hypothetical protein
VGIILPTLNLPIRILWEKYILFYIMLKPILTFSIWELGI